MQINLEANDALALTKVIVGRFSLACATKNHREKFKEDTNNGGRRAI